MELVAAVCRRDGKCPPVIWHQGHNRVSTVFDIGTEDDEVGQRIVDFTRTTLERIEIDERPRRLA